MEGLKIAFGIICLIVLFGLLSLGGCATYNSVRVWNAETAGKASLAEASQNRQIKTLEAKAKKESAIFEAEAEVERARGVAQANDIIMAKLGGPRNYLAYLQIQALESSKASLIYVPTESGLPITEASRLSMAPAQ